MAENYQTAVLLAVKLSDVSIRDRDFSNLHEVLHLGMSAKEFFCNNFLNKGVIHCNASANNLHLYISLLKKNRFFREKQF